MFINNASRYGLGSLLAALLPAIGSSPVQSQGMPAPGWNMYSGSANVTEVIRFSTLQYPVGTTPVDPNMGPDRSARVNAQIGSFAFGQAIVDTGSTGIVSSLRPRDDTRLSAS